MTRAGQYYDTETDLFENWHRYYDANTGRYLEPDPIWKYPESLVPRLASGHFDPVYAYGSNNPISSGDPTGMVADQLDNQPLAQSLGDEAAQLEKKCGDGDQEACSKVKAVAAVTALAPFAVALGAGDAAAGALYISQRVGVSLGMAFQAVQNFLSSAGGSDVQEAVEEEAPQVAQTAHGALRMADPSRLGAQASSELIQSNPLYQQADGANVCVQEAEGRFNVVVSGEKGVITTFKNLSQKSLDRLARNYGWTPTPKR